MLRPIEPQSGAAAASALRVDLINAQYDLLRAGFPVVIVVAGNDRLGMVELVQLMHEWMDARYIQTHVFEAPAGEEVEHPFMWRYWRALPPRGIIGLYVAAWPLNLIGDRALGLISRKEFDRRLDQISRFERMLTLEGTLVIKFWVQTPRELIRERLRRAKKHPQSNWRVEPVDRDLHRILKNAQRDIHRLLACTDTDHAPWHVLDGSDERARNRVFVDVLATTLKRRLSTTTPPPPQEPTDTGDGSDALGGIDLSPAADPADNRRRLDEARSRVAAITRRARKRGVASVLVFEGWDAAGKGSAIRRITHSMAVRDYRVVAVAAPSEEERARPYLWRFWRQLPRAGQMLILDRSWYGRVLVERVEGLARPDEWQRAYDEINDFEAQLTQSGVLLLKFWLHIDRDEQLRRFHQRANTPYKKYKLTEEDLRNRERWDDYVAAANEMIARTGTAHAPWHVLAANDKRQAQLEVVETVRRGLQRALRSP